MTISEKIRSIRNSKRMTQTEVASKVGLERSFYSRIENKAGNRVHFEVLLKICDVFGMSIEELLAYPEPSTEGSGLISKLTDENKNLKKQYVETRIVNQLEQVLIGMLLERDYRSNMEIAKGIKECYKAAASFVALQFNKNPLALEIFNGPESVREFIYSERTRQLVDSTIRSLFFAS